MDTDDWGDLETANYKVNGSKVGGNNLEKINPYKAPLDRTGQNSDDKSTKNIFGAMEPINEKNEY